MLDFSKNHFELFGLPPRYIIDLDELSDRYRELQRVMHPDRFAQATDQERRLSIQGAAQINQAYQVLRDPVGRARYLLYLNGFDMDIEKETTTDGEFLMEQLQLREELDATRHQPDPHTAIAEFAARVNKRIQSLTARLAVQFETATQGQLDEAREIVLKMQFLQKLRIQAELLEAELDECL